MNDNSDSDQPPTPRTLRMAGAIRFWVESGLSGEQMKEKLALQYAEATPHEIEHAVLLAQVMIIADEEKLERVKGAPCANPSAVA